MDEKYIEAVVGLIQAELPDYQIKSMVQTKNNGVQLHGIQFLRSDSRIAPTLYVDGFYEQGYSEQETAIVLMERFQEIKDEEIDFDIDKLKDFEAMKDRICYKLINKDANADMLSHTPFGEVADDLAIVYYIDLGGASITIHNGFLDLWNVTEDDLYEVADRNTQRIYSKVEFKSFNEVIADMWERSGELARMKEQLGFSDMPEEIFKERITASMDAECPLPVYVLKGYDNNFGASVLLYDNILPAVRERLGDDFIVFPSSIHEVIVMKYMDEMTASELREIVQQVNKEEISEEEQLSDNVYFCNGRELLVMTDDVIPHRYNQMQEAR